jgi:hypothetical protein
MAGCSAQIFSGRSEAIAEPPHEARRALATKICGSERTREAPHWLASSNPANLTVLYAAEATKFGSNANPLVGQHLGGNSPSAADSRYMTHRHCRRPRREWRQPQVPTNIAWRIRQALALDKVPAGVGPDHNDEIIDDLAPDKRAFPGSTTLSAKLRRPILRSRFTPVSFRSGPTR